MKSQGTQHAPVFTGLKRLGRQLAFAFDSRWPAILAVLAIIVFLLFDGWKGWALADGLKELWDKEINQIISVATLLVALSVWWGDVVRGWREALPKKFTVNFSYAPEDDAQEEPAVIMRCINADLSDVADIRALGQQIGRQLANPDEPNVHLGFRAPSVRQKTGVIRHLPQEGFFLHYEVEFILTSGKDLDTAVCKTWRAPFRKKDIEICSLKP